MRHHFQRLRILTVMGVSKPRASEIGANFLLLAEYRLQTMQHAMHAARHRENI